MAAFEAAGDPERYPDLGEPWQPLKLYYHHSFNRPRMEALHSAMLEHGLESPWQSASRVEAGARVGRADHHAGALRRVLRRPRPGAAGARRSDRPGRALVRDPRELREKVWPTEEFELVVSHVSAPSPEDDLFAGIADPA